MEKFDQLRQIAKRHQDRRILDLFENDTRMQQFTCRADEMLFDFSKTNLDAEGLNALLGWPNPPG